jgi:hypothetical protein
MGMQPSQKAFADLQALGAAAGVTKSVFQHLNSSDIDALAQTPEAQRPQAVRKTLTNAVVSSLSESGQYLKASTSSRVVQNARADASIEGRGVISDSTFGYVSKTTTDTSAMMESIRQKEPKFFAAMVSRIEDSATNMAALEKLSKANFEMRGKEIFEGNVTAKDIREWVAGNAKPAHAIQAVPQAPKATAPKI